MKKLLCQQIWKSVKLFEKKLK